MSLPGSWINHVAFTSIRVPRCSFLTTYSERRYILRRINVIRSANMSYAQLIKRLGYHGRITVRKYHWRSPRLVRRCCAQLLPVLCRSLLFCYCPKEGSRKQTNRHMKGKNKMWKCMHARTRVRLATNQKREAV